MPNECTHWTLNDAMILLAVCVQKLGGEITITEPEVMGISHVLLRRDGGEDQVVLTTLKLVRKAEPK